MPSEFTLGLSGNYKSTMAKHRAWQCGVLSNGESWPRVIGATATSASDIYKLGIIPAFNLSTPSTTTSGTSTAGTYGIVIVYRSIIFKDGLTGDDIQSNCSNIVDVTLTDTDAVVLTKVVSSDSKVTYIDIYAAEKIEDTYGQFYRIVKDCANSDGTVTFNIQISNLIPIGAGVTGGTADDAGVVLVTDNDWPQCQPLLLEVNGRMVMAGGIVKRVNATFTNGSSTVTTAETVYDGIEFWNIRRDTDASGGFDGKGTYLCRYVDANTVKLVNVDGTDDVYDGTTGNGTASIWTEPNLKYSKFLNPHAFPVDNVRNDYPSAILAIGKVPNTNRVLVMGKDWVVAEDFDRLPLQDGLNFISTEYGCGSHFSVVAAHGRLFWLDFNKGKREICMSDGTTVVPISTRKIKSILKSITLDVNGDPWRLGYIHGDYYRNEDTIRWALYVNNNTVANFVLELDLNLGDLRNDPIFYGMRYLDIFTMGQIRGRNFVGQYGWNDGIARLGIDNVDQRYRDWVPSGTIAGDLAASGQSQTVLTVATGYDGLETSGDGLKGIQVLVWREFDANGDLVDVPTYYHCRISANTSSTFTINYCETVDAVGNILSVDTMLPETPSGTGWKFRIGVIQAIAGPKWFTAPDSKSPLTFRELALVHKGQNVSADSNPIRVHFHENFDETPRDGQYAEAVQQSQQVEDSDLSSSSFARPTTNPVVVTGFTIVDNNVDTKTTSLDIETITLDFSEQYEQTDQMR
ncbi:MAG: hypothetical protein QXH80_00070 [Candidatus Nanoarchaeia archaeon]